MAVLAVDAAARRASRGQLAQTGVVPIRRRRVKEGQHLPHFPLIAEARQNGHNAGLVQSVLDALFPRQSDAEGRLSGVQQLPPQKGFMTVMATPSRWQRRYRSYRSVFSPIP